MVKSQPSLRMRQNAPVHSRKEKKEAHRKNTQVQPKYAKTKKINNLRVSRLCLYFLLQEKRAGYHWRISVSRW